MVSPTGPNRNKYRLLLPHMEPKTEKEHNANLREMRRAYPESLINLEVSVHVRSAVSQASLNPATVTPITFDTIVNDDYGFFDAATSPSDLVVPRSLQGEYMLYGCVEWPNVAMTNPAIAINVNNAAIDGNRPGGGAAFGTFCLQETSGFHYLNEGDVVNLRVRHNNAAAVTIGAAVATNLSPDRPALKLCRIAVKG